MGLADLLSGTPEPCSAKDGCRNYAEADASSACGECGFAARFPGLFNRWLSWDGKKHPSVIKAKMDARRARQQATTERRLTRDRAKVNMQRLATAAERRTERSIIRSTVNSGRANKDGDHVMAGDITLDTKLQTRNVNPVVQIGELDKVSSDARRAGKSMGGLVLRNRNGLGVVVLFEDDFARLVKGLT